MFVKCFIVTDLVKDILYYLQGMHEILAFILNVIHEDCQSFEEMKELVFVMK